jgi:hypothetical protein
MKRFILVTTHSEKTRCTGCCCSLVVVGFLFLVSFFLVAVVFLVRRRSSTLEPSPLVVWAMTRWFLVIVPVNIAHGELSASGLTPRRFAVVDLDMIAIESGVLVESYQIQSVSKTTLWSGKIVGRTV